MKLIFKKSVFIYKLNRFRDDSGLTVIELTKRMGIPKSTFVGYCSGANLPEDLTTLKIIARYFKVTLCELTGGIIR